MKISKESAKTRAANIQKYAVSVISDDKESFLAYLKSMTPKKRLWFLNELDFRVYMQIAYNSQHPNILFINGERLFKQDESYPLYPNNSSDTHKTAMYKHILKNLWGIS